MHETVSRLSIPNPFFEGRNSVYVIQSDPITVVDTGVATDKAFDALQVGLRELGLSVADVHRVILTHKHIDHIGNAWRIQQANGAEVYIYETERRSVEDVDPSGTRFANLVSGRLDAWGVPAGDRPGGESAGMPAWRLEGVQAQGLVDGQTLPQGDVSLEVIHTPGHTMGSICIRMGSCLFSGDHVLPDLSPNIGAGDMRNSGMLGRYFASLQRVQQLDVDWVYPGHGEPFQGLASRCQELARHHDERLADTLHALASGPRSVFEVAAALFGGLDGIHVVLGCAEANAHLELLVERGQVTFNEDRYELVK